MPIRLTVKQHKSLKSLAKKRLDGIGVSQLLREIVADYLERAKA